MTLSITPGREFTSESIVSADSWQPSRFSTFSAHQLRVKGGAEAAHTAGQRRTARAAPSRTVQRLPVVHLLPHGVRGGVIVQLYNAGEEVVDNLGEEDCAGGQPHTRQRLSSA